MQRTVILDQLPAPMDDEVIRVSGEQAHSLGYPFHLLGSMAGHDAAHGLPSREAGCCLYRVLAVKAIVRMRRAA